MTFEPECLETETPKAFPSASFQREFLFVPFQSNMTVATLGLSTKWREYMMELGKASLYCLDPRFRLYEKVSRSAANCWCHALKKVSLQAGLQGFND